MIAIVTGCAQGIGKAIALDLLNQGYFVIGIDKNSMALASLEATLNKEHQFFIADCSKKEDLDFCINDIISKNRKIDLLVNNACFSNHGLLSQCDWDAFNEVLMTGVTAPYYLTLRLMKQMSIGASIINIGSSRAHQSQKDTESYSAAKGAIESLTHAMAMSLAGKCRVNCIAPGWIDTFESEITESDLSQHPSKRIGMVSDIVKAMNYLKDEDNGFVNATTLVVDGGMSKQMIYHNDEGWTYHE